MTADPWFLAAVFAVAVFSGATAALVGFGIGSMLTPLMATRLGMDVAVAAVMVPHALATAFRCWRLRANIDWHVVVRFGLLSAAGALAGALVYTRLEPRRLSQVLGVLLLLTATAQLTGWSRRWRPQGAVVPALGLASGLFGGLAGNQGGMRAAALSAFDLGPAAFVATATAIGLLVDVARAPVYVVTAGARLLNLSTPLAIATAGVLIGTVAGERILLGLSPSRFARIVGVAIGALGIWLLVWVR